MDPRSILLLPHPGEMVQSGESLHPGETGWQFWCVRKCLAIRFCENSNCGSRRRDCVSCRLVHRNKLGFKWFDCNQLWQFGLLRDDARRHDGFLPSILGRSASTYLLWTKGSWHRKRLDGNLQPSERDLSYLASSSCFRRIQNLAELLNDCHPKLLGVSVVRGCVCQGTQRFVESRFC